MEIVTLIQPTAPNAISGAARGFSQLTDNIETFLTLLTTQLRNQDPLNPLEVEKFTEQLVQFASVEQSISTNTNLETLIRLQSAAGRESAIGLIGRTVVTASNEAALTEASDARWTYSLPQSASETSLTIVDEAGRSVATLDGATRAGAHQVVWNGRTDDGDSAASGVYRLVVTARDDARQPVEPTIEAFRRVSGLDFSDGQTRLETAAGTISLDDVTRVTDQ